MIQKEPLGRSERRSNRNEKGHPPAAVFAFLLAVGLCAAGCSSLQFLRPRGSWGGSLPPDVRFVTRDDLLLKDGPVQLDVIFTLHPGIDLDPARMSWEARISSEGRAAAPRPDPREIFAMLTSNVMVKAFRSAIEVAPGGHSRLEELRRILSAQGSSDPALAPFRAKALVLVDFRPCRPGAPMRPGQLLVQIFDISFPRYEELSLFSPRLLVFEDFAEVRNPESPAQFAGTLVLAWREILSRLGQSDRFQRYLASGSGPLSRDGDDNAVLFGLIPPQRIARRPDPSGHEWIEKTILFPPARTREPPPPAAPTAGTPAPASPSIQPPNQPAGPPPVPPVLLPPCLSPREPGPVFSDVAPPTSDPASPGSNVGDEGAPSSSEGGEEEPPSSVPISTTERDTEIEGTRTIGEPDEAPGLPPEIKSDPRAEGR